MAELSILFVGLLISIILLIAKWVLTLTSWTILGCFIPLLIALIIVGLIHGLDVLD